MTQSFNLCGPSMAVNNPAMLTVLLTLLSTGDLILPSRYNYSLELVRSFESDQHRTYHLNSMKGEKQVFSILRQSMLTDSSREG